MTLRQGSEAAKRTSKEEAARENVARRAHETLARLGGALDFVATIIDGRVVGARETEKGTPVAASPPDPPMLPGHEDIEAFQLLAQGGMGRVLLARQRSLQRDVAVKTVRPELCTPKRSRELLEESVITGSLEHPNIIPVHSLGFDGAGHPFLVMKRAEGVAWSDLIDDPSHEAWERLGVLDDDRLAPHLDILRSVCSAVHYAHRRGVVHRDIKPANVMVGELGEVYLVDWGIATALAPDDPRYRLPSLGLCGTPAFMAPEMVSDDGGSVDARTDVYLLGATLHYVLTREPRHGGSSMHEVFARAMISAPVAYGPDVPEELAAIANRATDASPERRFPTAAAFRAAITEFLAHHASTALSDKAQRRLDDVRSRWGMTNESTDDAERARLRQLLNECRLGFEHALESWRGNPRAREGARECALLSLRDAVACGNVVGAEALLLEIEDAPAALLESVRSLRKEHDAREERDERHRQRERQEDWTIGARTRAAFFFGLAVVGLVVWLWANGGHLQYAGTRTPKELATTVGVALAVACAVVAVIRRRLITSRVTERLVYGVLLTVAAFFACHVANCFPVPYSASLLSTELIFCAYGASLGGLMLARWLWLQVPIWLAGALLVRAAPSFAGMIFAISALLSLGIGLWQAGGSSRDAPGG